MCLTWFSTADNEIYPMPLHQIIIINRLVQSEKYDKDIKLTFSMWIE